MYKSDVAYIFIWSLEVYSNNFKPYFYNKESNDEGGECFPESG